MKSEDVPEELKKLQDNRALILLVELMGFLHDVGKMDDNLYTNHNNRYDKDVEFTKKGEKSQHYAKVPQVLITLFEEKFENLLAGKVENEVLDKVKECKIRGFQRHHTGKNYPEEYWPQNWLEEIVNLADNKDSSEDRGKAIHEQKDFIASVFGTERKFFDKEKYNALSKEREKFYHDFLNQKIVDKLFKLKGGSLTEKEWNEFHQSLIVLIRDYFIDVPAFTKRAANDITLFDHSYMTGSISKALTAKAIINPEIIASFQPKSEAQHFDNELDLNLLMVSFDGFGFICEGVNLLDVRGRKKVLGEIKDLIKNLFEVEFPLGNCIYEDENNLCFLVTPLGKESSLFIERSIYEIFNNKAKGLIIPVIQKRENLRYYGGALTKVKRETEILVKQDYIKSFKPSWIEDWNGIKDKERCVLCGKLPQWKGNERDNLCYFCWMLRYRIKGGEAEDIKGDSPWIDEIADENGKVALIIGRFHPIAKWFSGEFLKYQKIRTLEDVKKAIKNKKANGLPSFEDSAKGFVRNFYQELNDTGDLVKFLRKTVGSLNKIDKEKREVLGWRSKVGEFYYRLSEENQGFLLKSSLSEEQIEKISQELIKVITTKPPSPSRLYRIWRELEGFSESVIEDSRKKVLKGKRLKFTLKEFVGEMEVYDAVIPYIGRIEVFFDKEKEEFNTIERIDINKARDKRIRIEEEEFLEKHVEFEKMKGKHDKIEIYKEGVKKGSFEIKGVDFEDYKQFREILTSPNGFLFVIPANKAFDIVKSIKNEFNEIFSKVLGNISLNVGVMFSHRKFPIYITLDCARRMISEFNSFDFEEGEVASRKDSQLTLKIRDKMVEMNISNKLGDGKEDDLYYPYLRGANEDAKHINEIKPSDKLKLILSRFDFEFLDSSTKRFDVAVNGDKRREHTIIGENGPKPYLLEDLEKFERLKKIFEAIGSWTPIRDIEALAASKRLEWGEEGVLGDKKNVYEELIDSSLENKISKFFDTEDWKNNIKPFLLDSIMEGSFFDAIELFKSIMKMELKGGVE
jgi:CRISPR-associated Csx11 family protein